MNTLITPKDAIEMALIFTRVIALFLSFPLLNTSMIPTNVKILLVISFSFFIASKINIDINLKDFTFYTLAFLILKELFIGFSLGLLVNIFISAFAYASEIISYFMGLTVVNIFDTTFGQISVLDRFFILLFYFIFFITDSYQYVIGSIYMSFNYIPLDSLYIDNHIWKFIIEKSEYIFILAFQIAFPFALILYLLNLALALVNRLIPQINVFIVGLPMQIFAGLLALSFGSAILIYTITTLLQRMGEDYIGLIKLIGH